MNNNELLLPNKIIKSKRRSISLIIKNNGEFIVRAPQKTNDCDIFRFINQKANWIINKRVEQINNSVIPLSFDRIENIMLLGKQYEIVYSDVTRTKITETQLIVPKDKAKARLIAFLKSFAKKHMIQRVKLISELFQFKYESISISSAKTCWGSCSANNKLHFTYKLIMCPEDVIDYIVLHELCHTKVKNHSAKFWSLVQSCNPHYKIHEKWLKKNRAIIELI